FPSAAKRELTPLSQACQQLFFASRKFFSGRRERLSPRRRSGNLTALPSVVNIFFSKNFQLLSVCPYKAKRSQLRDVSVTQPKHLDNLPQNRFGVNPYEKFFLTFCVFSV
ncbi:hypothetical protein, partial [uncultured Bilophila sp.]